MTDLFREHFDEFIEEAKLPEFLVEPLPAVLDTCLKQLHADEEGGRGELIERHGGRKGKTVRIGQERQYME